MSPEDVPAELVRLIRQSISDPGSFLPRGHEDRDGDVLYETVTRWGARAVIAAVLPEHERMIREQVAVEIAEHGEKLLNEAIEQIKDGKQEGFSATLRAAAIASVADLVRGGES